MDHLALAMHEIILPVSLVKGRVLPDLQCFNIDLCYICPFAMAATFQPLTFVAIPLILFYDYLPPLFIKIFGSLTVSLTASVF
jgi:hypothetical protein